MGVGIAMCASAAVAYCALKCKDHFGRYSVTKEEERFEDRMTGVYHITTSDFDPTVHTGAYTPLKEGTRNGTFGFPGPGDPPNYDDLPNRILTNTNPPNYDDLPNRILTNIKHGHENGDSKSGSNGSGDIVLDIEVHKGVDYDLEVTQIGDNNGHVMIDNNMSDIPRIVVTCVDDSERNVTSVSSIEKDEGICLEQDHVIKTEEYNSPKGEIHKKKNVKQFHGDKVPLV